MKTILLVFCTFLCITICAQNTLNGIVLSDKDQKPVEAASVYINGSTQGTYTDVHGAFTINDVPISCQLIVSHVSYNLKVIMIDKSMSEKLIIHLGEKTRQLTAIAVSGESRRKQNIEEFKTVFLGNDQWGKHAVLKADSGLVFLHRTDTLFRKPIKSDSLLLQYNKTLGQDYGWTKDSAAVTQAVQKFCVRTSSPVTIGLPLLGYDVVVDIDNFTLSTLNKQKMREYYIYSHFIPRQPTSEQDKSDIEKNRREVYFNSSRHFCKALFNNELKENGYLISFGTFANDYTKPQFRHYIDISPYIFHKSDGEIMVVGLKGKTLVISYFNRYKNGPVNLSAVKNKDGSLRTPWEYYSPENKSYITFNSDTCIINRNGTIAENNIVFSGKMATKCGGALLPEDYDPRKSSIKTASDQTEIIPVKVNSGISAPNNTNQILLGRSSGMITGNRLNSFTQHFATFAREYPQEKAYLHFDNTAYFLGETIWFKAYVVTAERNNLSPLSKTLYTELVTPEGNIVTTKKFKIENGQCHGEFQLPDSMYSGFYEVRAYTRYMLNQEKEYLFSRVFPVYEKPKKAGEYNLRKIRERYYSQRVPGQRKVYEQKGALMMTFYPEGGNLVIGLKSKVAFKATGKEGENAIVSGEVLDAAGNKVSELETTYLGMGTFEFTPGVGKYTAKVRYNDKEYSFELPQALATGYAMTADNTDNEKINLLIQKSPQLKADTLGISVSCRGKLYATDQITMGEENMTALSIPCRLLPSGVSQITLFNRAGEVLSDRLVFVNHNSQMKITAGQDKRSYQPFEKVNMDFQLNDMKGIPVETTFSVAVRDAAFSTYNPYNDNILSNLLLSSELKGYIENPGYYFESDDPARRAALDLLMLTQGWSRYVWKEMAGVTKHEVKHPIEKSLVIEGHVLSLTKKKPKPNVEVLMFITLPDSTSQRGTCVTDKDGRFNFALSDFKGKAKLTLQTKENGKRTENNIVLDRMFSPEYKVYSYQEKLSPESVILHKDSIFIKEDTLKTDLANEITIDKRQQETKLLMDKKTHRLKEVVVKGKKKFKREGEGMRNASVVYDVEKTVDEMIDKGEDEPMTVLDYIHRINPFFTYDIDAGYTYVKGRYKTKGVLFCLNNVSLMDSIDSDTKPLCNYERLSDFSANEIETITVSETDGTSLIYEPIRLKRGDEVVIFIYTNKNLIRRNTLVGIRQTKLNGYAYTKEFFHPNYDKALLPDEKDYRRTLYWNPDVKTDSNGKATICFFNNGSCKAMNLSAETVTEKGVIGAMCK